MRQEAKKKLLNSPWCEQEVSSYEDSGMLVRASEHDRQEDNRDEYTLSAFMTSTRTQDRGRAKKSKSEVNGSSRTFA